MKKELHCRLFEMVEWLSSQGLMILDIPDCLEPEWNIQQPDFKS